MTLPEFTLVVGVDARHLRQLSWTWPTWKRHKPGLLDVPMLAFHDRSVTCQEIRAVVDHPNLATMPWPPVRVEVDWGSGGDKWTDPQRVKMLTGFVYCPCFVQTPWWLKLDTDVVATGQPDWIDPAWFSDPTTAIVSAPWSFTKPADQMARLDAWAERGRVLFPRPPLGLTSEPGADRLRHRRIISWCGFFRRELNAMAWNWSRLTCPAWRMPVPSQDGLLWYVARRMNWGIVRPNMKRLGWQHWSTERNVMEKSAEAMR